MASSTLVSVIVAAHDEERYIGRCLRSLLAQRFARQQFEIVVVDRPIPRRLDVSGGLINRLDSFVPDF